MPVVRTRLMNDADARGKTSPKGALFERGQLTEVIGEARFGKIVHGQSIKTHAFQRSAA